MDLLRRLTKGSGVATPDLRQAKANQVGLLVTDELKSAIDRCRSKVLRRKFILYGLSPRPNLTPLRSRAGMP